MFENIKDPYHASLLHVFLVTFGLFRADNPVEGAHGRRPGSTPRSSRERGEQELNEGTRRDALVQAADLALHDPRLLDPVREFPGDATVSCRRSGPT